MSELNIDINMSTLNISI